jgi:hypothetical protein
MVGAGHARRGAAAAAARAGGRWARARRRRRRADSSRSLERRVAGRSAVRPVMPMRLIDVDVLLAYLLVLCFSHSTATSTPPCTPPCADVPPTIPEDFDCVSPAAAARKALHARGSLRKLCHRCIMSVSVT